MLAKEEGMNRQDAMLAKKEGVAEPSAEFDALAYRVIGAAPERVTHS